MIENLKLELSVEIRMPPVYFKLIKLCLNYYLIVILDFLENFMLEFRETDFNLMFPFFKDFCANTDFTFAVGLLYIGFEIFPSINLDFYFNSA